MYVKLPVSFGIALAYAVLTAAVLCATVTSCFHPNLGFACRIAALGTIIGGGLMLSNAWRFRHDSGKWFGGGMRGVFAIAAIIIGFVWASEPFQFGATVTRELVMGGIIYAFMAIALLGPTISFGRKPCPI